MGRRAKIGRRSGGVKVGRFVNEKEGEAEIRRSGV